MGASRGKCPGSEGRYNGFGDGAYSLVYSSMTPSKLFEKGMEAMGIDPATMPIGSLCRYLDELIKWNTKMNLVARAPVGIIIENHFLDSLSLLRFFPPSPEEHSLMDIGTGAGFPGLAMKTILPTLPVTLVEPREKRVAFLRHMIRTLGLEGVHIMTTRLPPAPQKDTTASQTYSMVTSRALTDTFSFLTMAAPYCGAGGLVVCMKGPKEPREPFPESFPGPSLGLRLRELVEYVLPFSRAARLLMVFEKEASGSVQYKP